MIEIDRKTVKTFFILTGVFTLLLLIPLLMAKTGLMPLFSGSYETTDVDLGKCGSQNQTDIEARIAQNASQEYLGLSRTDYLPENEGMLFTFENESSHPISMRNMDFGLDVVYISSDGRINQITTLDEPDSLIEYYITYESTDGKGKYVLEMNSGWTDRNNIESGDCVGGLTEIS